jgi:hypothetical protein
MSIDSRQSVLIGVEVHFHEFFSVQAPHSRGRLLRSRAGSGGRLFE